MASMTILKNTSVLIDLQSDYLDTGWKISGGVATHNGCNPGLITLDLPLENKPYIVTYEVSNRQSGVLYPVSGTANGTSRNANGTYSEQITIQGNTLKFYASGIVSLKKVVISPLQEDSNAVTLAFNENENIWTTYYSYLPEVMCKFMNKFFSFKEGELWIHNENPVRNSFYGVKYKSVIEFYVNINSSQYKNFFSIRIEGNKVWYSPNKGDIYIFPTDKKPKGMLSRLKKAKYKNLNGDWFADFLRNMVDPRYSEEIQALMYGEELSGKVMKVRIENDDDDEVILEAVSVTTSPLNYTY